MRSLVFQVKRISAARLQASLFLFALIMLLVCSVMPRTGQAAAGDLDPTFGMGGKVTTDFFSFDQINDIAILSNGRIVAAGFSIGGSFMLTMARYNPNGGLDTSFGVGGKVINNAATKGNGLAVQSDGKVVVAGTPDFTTTRYNLDGSLDTAFGTAGTVTTVFGTFAEAFDVALQTDGKIVVVGRANNDFAVARYNSDGSPDTNFGVGGVITTDVAGNGNDEAHSLTIQSNGKIVVVGTAQAFGANFSFGLVRYNSDGSIDMTFGSGGKVVTGFSAFGAEAFAGSIQNDGRTVTAGVTFVDFTTERDFALARYSAGGTLDTSFGTGGQVTTDFFGLFDWAFAMAIQSNGKIIAAGFAVNPNTTNRDFGLARYNSNGSLDTVFGLGGKITTDFGGGFDEARAVAVQPDGKIVVAGSGNGSFALARYNGDPGFDICLQDASNGNSLQLDSITGNYQFTNCNGLILSGTGTVIRKGSTITLQHNAADRRVLVKIDASVMKATATIQTFSPAATFTIIDRNTSDSLCNCAAGPPGTAGSTYPQVLD